MVSDDDLDAKEELDDLLDCCDLSDWEMGFVEDMEEKIEFGLTGGQRDKLHEIWMERCT